MDSFGRRGLFRRGESQPVEGPRDHQSWEFQPRRPLPFAPRVRGFAPPDRTPANRRDPTHQAASHGLGQARASLARHSLRCRPARRLSRSFARREISSSHQCSSSRARSARCASDLGNSRIPLPRKLGKKLVPDPVAGETGVLIGGVFPPGDAAGSQALLDLAPWSRPTAAGSVPPASREEFRPAPPVRNRAASGRAPSRPDRPQCGRWRPVRDAFLIRRVKNACRARRAVCSRFPALLRYGDPLAPERDPMRARPVSPTNRSS